MAPIKSKRQKRKERMRTRQQGETRHDRTKNEPTATGKQETPSQTRKRLNIGRRKQLGLLPTPPAEIRHLIDE